MDTQTRFAKILVAAPTLLAKIDNLLEGNDKADIPIDRRLLTFSDAAKELSVSRQTIWRMAIDGRLPTVEIRPGTRRIPSAALTALLKGGVA